jgi:uncharacterized membrane protein YkoI
MSYRFVLVAAVVSSATAAMAAEPRHCFTRDERAAVTRAHKVVPLAKAVRHVRARYPGDLVAVRLCEQGKHLFYVLTVLPHSGKVVNASVDAATGAVMGGS